jgi:PAS domain S-box-containing protein
MNLERYSKAELINELTQLQENLNREKRDKEELNEKLSRQNLQLREREKELNGIYQITQLLNDPDHSVNSVLQKSIKILANSYLYPDISCGRLSWGNKIFVTDNFEATRWSQRVKKELSQSQRNLVIEIFYLEKRPSFDEGTFLQEERNLMETIAQELAIYLKRKLSEEEISLNADKFQSVFNSVQDAIFIHDFEGNFIEINEEACRRLNYSREELLSFTPMDVDETSYAEKAPGIFQKVNEKGSYKGETIHVSKDGTKIPTELNSNKIIFKGQPLILTVARDITKRKKYENELLNARKKAENDQVLIQKSLENIKFLSDCAIQFIDNSYENDIYSYIAKKLLELNPEAYVVVNKIDYEQGVTETKSFKSYDRNINETLKNLGFEPMGRKYAYDKRLLGLADGKLKKLDIGIRELTFGEISKDVAAKIEDQLQLENIYGIAFMLEHKIYANAFFLLPQGHQLKNVETLEGFVNIASLAIKRRESDKRLVKAKEKAEEGDRLKSAFLNNLSHEIRTPLNAIMGYADLLNSKNIQEDKKQEFIYYIRESGNKLLSVLNDILDVASLETNQMQIDNKSFSLNALIDELGEQIQNNINTSSKNIKLSIYKDLKDGGDFIVSDYSNIHKIYALLIDNALKFTREGVIEIGYKDTSGTIDFYISDTGIGVPGESKSMIFGRFIQLDNSITRRFEGLGLGLYIAKALVNRLGGTIEFNSEVNKGSTVIFKLPTQTSNQQTEGKEEMQSNIEDMSDKTILIVEDEIINFSLINDFFLETRVNIEYAENGLKAIEWIKKTSEIDLILMDIKMPVLDGISALEEIKKINSNIPIVALTAYAFENDKKRLMDRGFDGYLSKPVDQHELMKLTKKIMANK